MFYIKNNGGHYEAWSTGVLGPVMLHGLNEHSRDLSWQKWSYQVSVIGFPHGIKGFPHSYKGCGSSDGWIYTQVGMKGETMDLNSLTGVNSVEWMEDSSDESNTRRPLSWYKV